MKKREINTVSKKIVITIIAVFMFTVSINPGFASNIYANSETIQGVFNETLSEDKRSSKVELTVDKKDNQTIESIILPDKTEIAKEDFQYDSNKKLLVSYTATENGKLEYSVNYTEVISNATTIATNHVNIEQSTSDKLEKKTERLSYEVKNIEVPKTIKRVAVSEKKDDDNISMSTTFRAISKKSTPEQAFTFNSSTGTITGYDVSIGGTDVVIPDFINGVQVNAIGGHRAFFEKGLTSVVFPVTLTSIGSESFSNNNIKNIILPRDLVDIGIYAFSNNQIETVEFGHLIKTIGENAFYKNNIKNVFLGAETIGKSAFSDNPLEEVTLWDSVKTIGAYAFMTNNVKSLRKINLGKGVESIGDAAFYPSGTNSFVTKVEIPASLKSIGKGVFSNNQIPYLELHDTNPKTNYGKQKMDAKWINKKQEGESLTINLKELYPGIDTSKINITKILPGISSTTLPYTYNSNTGELVIDDIKFNNTYLTFYYSYMDGSDVVLEVVQQMNFTNILTVKWDDYDGTNILTEKYQRNYNENFATVNEPNRPLREGYTFTFWSKDPVVPGRGDFEIVESTTYTANYKENSYNILYDLDYDMSETIQPRVAKWTTTNISNVAAKRDGYIFTGWSYNNKIVKSTDSLSTIIDKDPGDNSDITLIAKWKKPSSIPVITANNVVITVGDSFDPISDTNVSAYDDVDGNITITEDNIVYNDVDTAKVGNYNITYQVQNKEGAITTKTITIKVIKKIVIDAAKEINLVVGDVYDPYDNVTITDGEGNNVTLTADMIVSNNVAVDSNGKTTKRGIYEVWYRYTDTYGNTETVKTMVYVHGQLQFNSPRRDSLTSYNNSFFNTASYNSQYAYYINARGASTLANYVDCTNVPSGQLGKFEQTLTYTHPVNNQKTDFIRNVYVHEPITINVPTGYAVKVNTNINVLDGVTATYKYVNDDGTITEKDATLSTDYAENTFTSAVPTRAVIVVKVSAIIVPDLIIQRNIYADYVVYFNGIPEIKVTNDSITVRKDATFEEFKNILNATASVQYGDDTYISDLTSVIDWNEVRLIDTSKTNETNKVKIYVTDKDGYKVEKEVTIKISKDIIINLPSLDKVVGDTYNPKDNVTIFDGQGNQVDLKDVAIDDSKVDMSKPGNYEVTYTYTDLLGNTETKKNTIRVHGKLQFEGINRVDLIEKNNIYLVDTAKAFYMNNEGKKIYVNGTYDNAMIDQNTVGKNEVIFSAVHPINNVKVSSQKQNVFVHGDIVFHKPSDIQTSKVNTTLDPSKNVTATYDHVNDDGSITTKNLPVTSKDVTSHKVGYVNGKVSASVEIVKGLTNRKDDTVKVAFNGLPYIDAANTIAYEGAVSNKQDIINKMLASAGMKLANGMVIDLTNKIDFTDVDRVKLNKSGTYEIILTVTDPDGFTTYTTVNVVINIATVKPVDPVTPKPIDPTPEIPTVNVPTQNNPVIPSQPQPTTPVKKDKAAAVSRDIPLSKTKDGITDDLVKSYITASTENKGLVDFEIISNNVLPKVGEYEATIRLEDGTVLTVKLRVVDDSQKDVSQPNYGQDKDCIIHWIILSLFAGYSIYAIAAMLKRRKDNKDLEKALEGLEDKSLNKDTNEKGAE